MLSRVTIVLSFAAAVILSIPSAALAQCCGKVCNPDGSSTACGSLVLDGVTGGTLTGCNEVPDVACAGGQVLLGGEVLNGCGCVLGNCVDGGLGSLGNAECTAAAVAGCVAGGNTVEVANDPDCLFCGDGTCSASIGEDDVTCPQDCVVCGDGTCSPGEDDQNCPQDCVVCGDGTCSLSAGEDDASCAVDCGCTATGASPPCTLVNAPAGCMCGADCEINGGCCADACDVCGAC